MEEISAHINTVGFHTEHSSILNYNKNNFDVQAHISQVETTFMIKEAAEDAKRQAAAERRALAAAATEVLERLQGEQHQYPTTGASIPPCCLLSAGLTTSQPLTTMAGTSPAPVSSIFLLQSTVMSTGTAAPATSMRPDTTPVSSVGPVVLDTAEEVVLAHTPAPQCAERTASSNLPTSVEAAAPIPGSVDLPLPNVSNMSTPLPEADRSDVAHCQFFNGNDDYGRYSGEQCAARAASCLGL